MKWYLILVLALASCSTITVSSPSGCAKATYKGTSLLGDEAVTCTDNDSATGTAGCTVGGQNPQQLIATIMGALTAAGVITAAGKAGGPVVRATPSGCGAVAAQ